MFNFVDFFFIGVILIEIIFLGLIVFYWEKAIFFTTISKKYYGIQKIHKGSVPRLGGLAIYFCSLLYLLSNDQNYYDFYSFFLLSLLPLIAISLKEDLFHNVSAYTRLIIIIISSTVLMYFSDFNFPVIQIYGLDFILQNKIFNLIFLSLCLTILANGLNIIDGTNGLLSFTAILQLISIAYLSFVVKDYQLIKLIIPYIIFISIFLLFNFPFGKIFAGDLGAYLFGFINGFIIIYFFGKNDDLLSWNAALILFYPIFEVLFSYIRKINCGKSPFMPDSNHLHLKAFFYLEKKLANSKLANNLTFFVLLPLILMPSLLIPYVYDDFFLLLSSILLMIIIYLTLYYLIPKKN